MIAAAVLVQKEQRVFLNLIVSFPVFVCCVSFSICPFVLVFFFPSVFSSHVFSRFLLFLFVPCLVSNIGA